MKTRGVGMDAERGARRWPGESRGEVSQDSSVGASVDELPERLRSLGERPNLYHCPGEPLPINSAVHQARLRAHYPKCQQCPHREDAGLLSEHCRTDLRESWRQRRDPSPVLGDGFRGVLWNQLTHRDIQQISLAFIRRLQAAANGGPAVHSTADSHAVSRVLVVGHDSRVSSLGVVTAAIAAVRELGVHVVDVGETSGPCLSRVVASLQATGGIHACSAGAETTSIGLDLYGPRGLPLSGESLYAILKEADARPRERLGRRSGAVQPFSARPLYLESLHSQFQNLAPCTVLVATVCDFVPQVLADLSREFPIQLQPLITPGPPGPETAAELRRQLQQQLQTDPADLGLWLAEDGQACEFYTSAGRLLAPPEVLAILLKEQSRLSPGKRCRLLLGEEWETEAQTWNTADSLVEFRFRQSLREHFARGMKTAQAELGLDGRQRYWFWNGAAPPVCDGLISLARLLRGLGTSPDGKCQPM